MSTLSSRFTVPSAPASTVGIYIDRRGLQFGRVTLVDFACERGSPDREVNFYVLGEHQRSVEFELNAPTGLVRRVQDANAVGDATTTQAVRDFVTDRFEKMVTLGWLTVRAPQQPDSQSDMIDRALTTGVLNPRTAANHDELERLLRERREIAATAARDDQ